MPRQPMWMEARQEAYEAQAKRRKRADQKVVNDARSAYSEDIDVEADDDESEEDVALKAKVVRHFGKSAPRILKMIEGNDAEGATIILQRALLSSAITALTQVENTTLATSGAKGIYAFNALISQIRELITDVQASQDTERIVEEIAIRINGSMRSMAEALLDQHHALKREVAAYLADEDVKTVNTRIDATTRALATYITQTRDEVNESIRSRLCD